MVYTKRLVGSIIRHNLFDQVKIMIHSSWIFPQNAGDLDDLGARVGMGHGGITAPTYLTSPLAGKSSTLFSKKDLDIIFQKFTPGNSLQQSMPQVGSTIKVLDRELSPADFTALAIDATVKSLVGRVLNRNVLSGNNSGLQAIHLDI